MAFPKGMADAIASKVVPVKVEEEGPEEVEGAPELEAAAEDVLSALDAGSASGLAAALTNFLDLYNGAEEEPE